MTTKQFILSLIFIGILCISLSIIIPTGKSAITFVDSDNGYYQIRLRTSGYVGDDTMNEIYNTDLSTKTPLQTRTGISSTDSNWLTFDRDMRIEDSKGFNNTQFTLRIYSVTGVLTTGTIEINTTMFDKTKTTHTVVFTTSGTYNIINTGDVVIFSNGSKVTNYVSTGSFSYQINQSRFGCISKNARSYTIHNAWLNIGQSATSCSALFQRCQIYFNNTHENYGQSSYIQVAGSTSDLTFKNVSLFSRFNGTYLSGQKTIGFSGRNLYMSNFSYDCTNTTVIELVTTTRKLFALNCLFKGCAIYNGNLTMDNVIIYDLYTNNYALYNNKIFSISDLTIKNINWGIAVNGNFNLTGVIFVKNNFIGIPILFTGNIYLIDCISDTWIFDSGLWTGKVHRSNSLYLRTIINGSSNNLSGVSVIIKNVTGVTKKTLTTDGSGLISRQILDYFTWTNYNNGYYDSPYTIYLSKTGYQNEVFKISTSNINNLTIPMISNITIPSSSLTLYENIFNSTGTHQSQYSSTTGWKVWANYTGTLTPLHIFENIIRATGTHYYRQNSTGWWVWANYTGNVTGLVAIQNIINAVGTHNYQYRPLLGVNGEWWVWANYTGISTPSSGINLTIVNPNPANGTLNTNFLTNNNRGLNTSVDITYKNFIVLNETVLGKGKQFEHYTTPICLNMRANCWGVLYYGQTFKVGYTGDNESHLIKNMSVYLRKRGSPTGNFYITINDVSYYKCFYGYYNWFPHLTILSSGYIDSSLISSSPSWYSINMSPYVLKPGVNYSIVFSFPSGTSGGDCIHIGYDECSVYDLGHFLINGVNGSYPYWDREDGQDFLFDIYGWGVPTNISWDSVLNLTFYDNSSGAWNVYDNESIWIYGNNNIFSNGTYIVLNDNFTDNNTNYYWKVEVECNDTILSNETYEFETGNITVDEGWLYIAGFDISPQFLLLGIFFSLFYFWWKSEDIKTMLVIAMVIVPYNFVVFINYVLPMYVTDASILLFLQIIFFIYPLFIMGYTIQIMDKQRKLKKKSS